jgi:alpha-ketoglutarate-dependent taurine dioxygenase
MKEPVDLYSNTHEANPRIIQSVNKSFNREALVSSATIPLQIEAALPSLKLDTWASDNLPEIEEALKNSGAILFRGFDVSCEEDLQSFTRAINLQLMPYMEGATPRKTIANNVYTSTEFPPQQAIALHNENSYVTTWPMRICFCCIVAPNERGETPIADVRRVLRRIHPEILDEFDRKGYMLVRNYSGHLGIPWRTSFHASTAAELESYCRRTRIEFEWTGPEELRTRQVRPAIATHPLTGEKVWFNHIAFWHISSIESSIREALLDEYTEEGMPFNIYFGDGTLIPDATVQHLRESYEAETVKFPWMKGDVLLLDNMLVAHGRSPFSGPRKIIVSLGNPNVRTDL